MPVRMFGLLVTQVKAGHEGKRICVSLQEIVLTPFKCGKRGQPTEELQKTRSFVITDIPDVV